MISAPSVELPDAIPEGGRVPELEARELIVEYPGVRGGLFSRRKHVRILDGLSLSVWPGETVGIVGESGSGKTTLLMSLLQLIRPKSGSILFQGRNILNLGGSELRAVRRELGAVFQNPFKSLNPRMRVVDLVGEPLRLHSDLSRRQRRARVAELLADVGVQQNHMDAFPRMLSGGQAQRIAIARALALGPRMLVLDEVTSALDVSVQAQVLNLLIDLQQKHALTYLFVSHDLNVVRYLSDRLLVMYSGEIIETGEAAKVFQKPGHPYTQALLSVNALNRGGAAGPLIKGSVPSFAAPPPGCRFHPRCPYALDKCSTVAPGPTSLDESHWARCHLLELDHP